MLDNHQVSYSKNLNSSNASATINSPIAVKSSDIHARFIRVMNASPEAASLFSSDDKPHIIISLGRDSNQEYGVKIYVNVLQIVCYSDSMLVEIYTDATEPARWMTRWLFSGKPGEWNVKDEHFTPPSDIKNKRLMMKL